MAARYDFAHKSRADRPATVPLLPRSRPGEPGIDGRGHAWHDTCWSEPPEVLVEPFCTSAISGWPAQVSFDDATPSRMVHRSESVA